MACFSRFVCMCLLGASVACSGSGEGDGSGGSGGESESTQSSGTASTTTTTATGGTSAGSDTASGTGSTTGIPPGDECRTAADCVLDDDCCHCSAYPGQLPEDHGCSVPSCDQSRCQELGVSGVECVAGHCVLSRVDCDASTVDCMAAPPNCTDGKVASVSDGCWTGKCVSISLCEMGTYFGCEECGPDEVCVEFEWWSGDAGSGTTACWPTPRGCEEGFACSCGQSICEGWGYGCYESGGGDKCCGGNTEAC